MSRSLISCRTVIAAGIMALAGTTALAADPQPTMPAIANDMVAPAPTARVASVEVFKPAPLPDENFGTPAEKVADSDQPNLHPDLLRMSEHGNGVLADTGSEYSRSSRVRPAGGMSLSIPMQ